VDAAALPRRERAIIVAALAGVSALSWLYLVRLARGMEDMTAMAGMAMAPALAPWSARDAALMFAMWWVMMVGMMLPSALPMTLTFATVNRRRRERGDAYVPTALFVVGYLLAWGAFSLAAAAAQWALERAALMMPMMNITSPLLGGLLFVAAGVYQLTPLKHACLRRCRTPLAFVLAHWRDGAAGALRMGAEHGAYCLGCCAFLMALLFVGGVMNLLWVAAIAVFVLLEKGAPAGATVARGAGALSIGFGAWMAVRALG
jgi:predicted metal-binding membrane protein